jgi:hypothetical protein
VLSPWPLRFDIVWTLPCLHLTSHRRPFKNRKKPENDQRWTRLGPPGCMPRSGFLYLKDRPGVLNCIDPDFSYSGEANRKKFQILSHLWSEKVAIS